MHKYVNMSVKRSVRTSGMQPNILYILLCLGPTTDTFDQIISKTKEEILKHVNRDRSIIHLLHMRQQDDTWMACISELEDSADLCQTSPGTMPSESRCCQG